MVKSIKKKDKIKLSFPVFEIINTARKNKKDSIFKKKEKSYIISF